MCQFKRYRRIQSGLNFPLQGIQRFSIKVDNEDQGILSVKLGIPKVNKVGSQFHFDMGRKRLRHLDGEGVTASNTPFTQSNLVSQLISSAGQDKLGRKNPMASLFGNPNFKGRNLFRWSDNECHGL